MDTILTINIVIAVVFTCCYAYQLFFLLYRSPRSRSLIN